ncbi:hypothetical protein [Kitasatospora sp. NPDC101183]|uniref:hypothetical protein n=1 Tax=Kitasatospora sp. NPDC101183 TaxID=3364100 RepID=UPI00380989D5
MRDHYETHHPHTRDLWSYLGAKRPVSVLRLRVEPGEGWIAPTVLLPFDESTEGEDLPSATASWLGHWERGLFGPLF